MTKQTLPNAKDWKARNIEDWNVSTFHSYLADKHVELYMFDYVPWKGWQVEKGMLKQFTTKEGNQLVKDFIDHCFSDYTPSAQYPNLSFGFMFTYMKGRILPRLLADRVKKNASSQLRKQQEEVTLEELEGLL